MVMFDKAVAKRAGLLVGKIGGMFIGALLLWFGLMSGLIALLKYSLVLGLVAILCLCLMFAWVATYFFLKDQG